MQSEGPAALGLQVILPPPNCGTFEKCGATGEHDVGEQRPAKVHVRLVDGEGQHLVEPLTLIPYQVWLEQQLGGPEARWPHLGNTRSRQTGLLLLLQVPASLLPPPGAGLATYVEGAAVWQGVNPGSQNRCFQFIYLVSISISYSLKQANGGSTAASEEPKL